MKLEVTRLSWDQDLQIIQGDVRLVVEDNVLIEEPLCIDVGLPALLLSALQNVEPNRWAGAEEWERMPFFVCGCGDPECRAFSFVVHHQGKGVIELIEVEERQNSAYRVLDSYTVDSERYKELVAQVGRGYLEFVKDKAYIPYLKETVEIVTELVERLERIS